jgi:UbiD family decarboxylase
MYFLPHYDNCPEFEVTAITMRGDRPIYRNHQTCPETDHQILPRLRHEAMVYNRLTELGLNVHEVRFPAWGGVFSCIFQVEYGRDGFINDALMSIMGAPWLNTKMVVAVSPDTEIENAAAVYHAIATRCDPHATYSSCRIRGGLLMIPPPHPLKAVIRSGSPASSASTPL